MDINKSRLKIKLFLTISLFSFLSCKAQTIIPIYNEGEVPSYVRSYHKDVDNDFNPFVGTWRWEDGETSLTITFNKIIHFDDGNGDYTDYLVGEYAYIEDGVELVNTFPVPLISDAYGVSIIIREEPWDNKIVSYSIRTDKGNIPECDECAIDTRFILLDLLDPTRPKVWGKITMGFFIESGVEKVRANIFTSFVNNDTGSYSGPTTLTIPDSVITLTRVE